MAVQAQYPSNILLLNRSNQEQKETIFGGGEYAVQSAQGGGDYAMIFDNGGVEAANPRKRPRQAVDSPNLQPVNLSPAVFNHLQLHHHQNTGVDISTGLRLCSEDHPQNLKPQQQQQQQQQIGNFISSPLLDSLLSDQLSAIVKQQKDDINKLIQIQEIELRRTLMEKRSRQYRALLDAAEEAASRRMREKEAEAEKAAQRLAELEQRAAQLTAEAAAWRERARAHEAAAAALQAQLQQAVMGDASAAYGRETCHAANAAGDAGSAHIDPCRADPAVPGCRVCCERAATVVLLPCRHLCVCTACAVAVNNCPLCFLFRSASVEVFLS